MMIPNVDSLWLGDDWSAIYWKMDEWGVFCCTLCDMISKKWGVTESGKLPDVPMSFLDVPMWLFLRRSRVCWA